MDINAFTRRENMLKLRETLIAVEEDRLAGKNGYSADALDEAIKKTIMEVSDGKQK